jgi:hypothetical protein
MRKIKVTINSAQNSCNVSPRGKAHVAPKDSGGVVNFKTNKDCTVQFSNAAVFGLSQKRLAQGNNELPVQINSGSTYYCFPGYTSGNGRCEVQRSGRKLFGKSPAESNPNQIIVP